MIKLNIGKNIRKYREQSGLTLRELGEKIGYSHNTIHSWEIDRTEPNIGAVEKMCSVFGCTKRELIGKVPELSPEDNYSLTKAMLREYIDQLSEEQAEILYKTLISLREK